MKEKVQKLELALKESEIRYRRLFETAQDGIILLDPHTGQITDVNLFLINLLDYSKEEFLEKKLWEVGAFKNMKAAKNIFKILQKEGYVRYEDLPLETKKGDLISVEFVSNSYMAGNSIVIQCNIRDVTERKKIESIKESRRDLEEEKLRVQSIANATHELRTPLAIIKGNVDLAMIRGGKSPQSALKAIDNEIKHLSGILTDLSLITSMAWNIKNKIIYKKINIKPIIKSSVSRCKALAFKKNISIKSAPIPNLTILGDKIYLEKMLVNLIKNSIIYGHKNGHTKIKVSKIKGFITISVSDNGIGISKKDLPHIFERFYRADNFHNSSKHSTGLGLAIVKWIAEIHDGKVTVTSTKNKGSIFTVYLAIKPATK